MTDGLANHPAATRPCGMGSVRFITAATCCAILTACTSGAVHTPAPTANTQSAVANYLAAVNALCDALLPKVTAALHGGHPDVYPVAEFTAELPAHRRLEADFDRQLALVSVPPAAAAQHAALQAYLSFADGIDAKRLAAAGQGQAAFDREIRAENAEFPTDPVAAARSAAGFDDSCNAR